MSEQPETQKNNSKDLPDKWDRLDALGEGPNPLSNKEWNSQLLQFFLGLLALLAVFLCIWNGILGFPITTFRSGRISLGTALTGLGVLGCIGIIFYLVTKPPK